MDFAAGGAHAAGREALVLKSMSISVWEPSLHSAACMRALDLYRNSSSNRRRTSPSCSESLSNVTIDNDSEQDGKVESTRNPKVAKPSQAQVDAGVAETGEDMRDILLSSRNCDISLCVFGKMRCTQYAGTNNHTKFEFFSAHFFLTQNVQSTLVVLSNRD